MSQWFDAKRGRTVDVFETKAETTVMARDRVLIEAKAAELLLQHDANDEGIDQIELNLDVGIAKARKLAAIGGILPFPETFLADHGEQTTLRLMFIGTPKLMNQLGPELGTTPASELVRVRGDNDFPALFDLSYYTFRDLMVPAPGKQL